MSEHHPYDDRVGGEPPAPGAAPRDDHADDGGRRRSRIPGCLAVLAAFLVLAGGLYLGASRGIDFLKDALDQTSAEDFPGPGKGKVLVEVKQGDTAGDMARTLEKKGVVASVQAFINAAAEDDRSRGIQVGFYQLKKEMSAADALEVMVNSDNLILETVTVPEGLRVVDILDILGEQTEFDRAAYQKVIDNPGKLGLPDYASGNPEGYLFPSTYTIGPKDKPVDILKAMVDRWRRSAEEAGLEERAAELGYTPHELMTIASLVEAEGRGDDMPKVARVIYNRLETEGYPTFGKLEIDAAVNYALNRKGTIRLTTAEIESVASSPYNTYKQMGLPPTPIEAPGDDAIAAAANPAQGPWFFYVTVNLKTGETKFTESYDEFLAFKAEYNRYCETSDAC